MDTFVHVPIIGLAPRLNQMFMKCVLDHKVRKKMFYSVHFPKKKKKKTLICEDI